MQSYVRENQETIEDHNVDTILEFGQVPQQLFLDSLYKIDKKY